MNYITIESVTEKLGSNWWADGDASLYVSQANAWLSAKRLVKFDEVPDAILLAGALLAKLSVSGELYKTTTEGVVKSKRVKADTVEVQKEYVSGSEQGKSSDMLFIEDLLAPYLERGFAINTFVRK